MAANFPCVRSLLLLPRLLLLLLLQASCHYRDSACSSLRKAAVDCELLPATLWLTNGLAERLGSISAHMMQQQLTDKAVAASQPQQQQQQSVSLPAGLVGAEVTAALHIARMCVVLPLVLPQAAATSSSSSSSSSSGCRFLVLDLHGGSSSSSVSGSSNSSSHYHSHHHHQQQAPLRAAAAAASSKVLPFLRLTSSSQSGAAAAAAASTGNSSSRQQQQQQQGCVVEGCLTRARVFLITEQQHKSSSSSSSGGGTKSGGLAAAAAKAAAAAAAAASGSSSLLLQGPQQHGYSLNRLLRKQQQQQNEAVASSSSSSKLTASCILDACPAEVPKPAAAAAKQGSAAAAAELGFGPDDVPWGSALFVSVTFDPWAQPSTEAVAQAAAMAAAHAKDQGSEEVCDCCNDSNNMPWYDSAESAAAGAKGQSGCGQQFGVLGFQQLCQQGSGLVVHVRAPAVTGLMSRAEVVALVESLLAGQAAAAAAPAVFAGGSDAAAGKQQQQQQGRCLQVAVLLQCRLQCCVQATNSSSSSSSSSGKSHHKHSYHQQHMHSTPSSSSSIKPHITVSSSSSKPPSLTSFEVSAEEYTLLHVQGLGGRTSATATCLSVQGLQLLTSQPKTGSSSSSSSLGQLWSSGGQLCGLLIPLHSKTDGPPGLEILRVSSSAANAESGDSSSSSGLGRTPAAAAAAGVISVLLRGATLSMDPGGLSMDWLGQLVEFCEPIAAAAAAAGPKDTAAPAATATSIKQQQQQPLVVVNFQDFALRCEPRSDTPTSHNSSRMAAALLLEGAHWTLNPGQGAPQQMLLHSLGFYVAAAAARGLASGPTLGLLLHNAHRSGGSGLASQLQQLTKAGSSSSGSSLGGWDASLPVDLHGFSLSAAGYHCIAQEGGLAVTIRPAAAAAAAAGGTAGML
jgi:hypothetical protein